MELPSYVKNKDKTIQKKWVAIYKTALSKSDEASALSVANAWLKKQKIIKQTFTKVYFEIDSNQLIKQDDNGDEYISAVLATTQTTKEGKKFTEDLLKSWEEDINNGNTIVGDVDHEFFDKIAMNASDRQIKAALKEKPSIAKAVKAIYDKGKLWVRLLIDKRYKNVIKKAKGLSIEGLVESDEHGVVSNGELWGMTFCVNEEPAHNGLAILA
jgi:hypothetical protein